MGIMDIFRGGQQAPGAPQPTQLPTPNNPNLPKDNPAAPAAATVADTAGTSPAGDPASPMAGFEKLWQNTDTNKGDPQAPLFDIDPAKLQEAVSKADFTAGIDPALLQKAQSGDSAAFQAVMNGVAQKAFSHQTMATTKLIEQALDRRMKEVTASVPDIVRKQAISENLADSPIFQHEATRPLMDALQVQLQAAYPKASAAQIAEHARSYVNNFAKLVAGKETPAADQAGGADDWTSFQ